MNITKTLTRALVATLGLLVSSQALAARTTTFYHNDGLGSVIAATNQAGQVLWRKDYAPFGEQIDTTPDTERQSYTGKSHDDVTGLTYFGGRYYDPQVGRFMSVDPVAFIEDNTMSFNRYLYVNNNPYKYVDPDGEIFNFALKFVLDVGINIALNYATTGSLGVGMALKESATGVLNPAKTLVKAQKLAKVLSKAGKKSGSAANKVSGETKFTSAGRRAHNEEPLPDGFQRDVNVPGTKLRMDGYNPNTKQILELKPNNARAVKRGEKQLEGYCDACDNSALGQGHTAVPVQTYDPLKYLN